MSVKPAQVCILEKDKLIDSQKGFVDTFNWVTSFCENIEGKGGVTVDKAVSDHPVVKLGDDEDGKSGGGGVYDGLVRVKGTDGSSNMTDDEWTAATAKAHVPLITFSSASDSNVKVTVTGDKRNALVTIGVYYT